MAGNPIENYFKIISKSIVVGNLIENSLLKNWNQYNSQFFFLKKCYKSENSFETLIFFKMVFFFNVFFEMVL